MSEELSASEELKLKWIQLQDQLAEQFGKRPDMNAILMLIGMRELGKVLTQVKKEEKVNLMHIAVCKLFSAEGYYELKGLDDDGWPHWEPVKKLPFVSVFEQELFLKQHIVDYFEAL